MRAIFIIFLLYPLSGISQSFSYQALLDTVPSSAFYNIPIKATLLGHAQPNLHDIRLLDEMGSQVPYVFERSEPLREEQVFSEMTIVAQEYEEDRTHLILHNPNKESISNVSLFVKNAEARKTATLSGSDDQKQWFVVKNRFGIQGGRSSNQTQELRMLNFPLIDYEFLKITIFDCFGDPINILKCGRYDYSSLAAQYKPIAHPEIWEVKDSIYSKTNLYEIDFEHNYPIDRIQFLLTGPEYYYRRAQILTKTKKANSKRRWKRGNTKYFDQWQVHEEFHLSSASRNAIDLDLQESDTYYLRIFNEDNPEISLDECQPMFLSLNLIAYLESGRSYRIVSGNEQLSKPNYDLRYFENKVPEHLSDLSYQQIENSSDEKQAESADWFSKKLVWGVLSAIILMVSFAAFRMIKKLDSTDKPKHTT